MLVFKIRIKVLFSYKFNKHLFKSIIKAKTRKKKETKTRNNTMLIKFIFEKENKVVKYFFVVVVKPMQGAVHCPKKVCICQRNIPFLFLIDGKQLIRQFILFMYN